MRSRAMRPDHINFFWKRSSRTFLRPPPNGPPRRPARNGMSPVAWTCSSSTLISTQNPAPLSRTRFRSLLQSARWISAPNIPWTSATAFSRLVRASDRLRPCLRERLIRDIEAFISYLKGRCRRGKGFEAATPSYRPGPGRTIHGSSRVAFPRPREPGRVRILLLRRKSMPARTWGCHASAVTRWVSPRHGGWGGGAIVRRGGHGPAGRALGRRQGHGGEGPDPDQVQAQRREESSPCGFPFHVGPPFRWSWCLHDLETGEGPTALRPDRHGPRPASGAGPCRSRRRCRSPSGNRWASSPGLRSRSYCRRSRRCRKWSGCPNVPAPSWRGVHTG